MEIIKIEISTKNVKPHGYVFFAKAYTMGTAIHGLISGQKEPAPNHFDIIVVNHHGYVTAGHALTMLMKKCKRMNIRISKNSEIYWQSKCGTPIEEILENEEIDTNRMNSIIQTLASKFKIKAVLPYLEK